MDTADDSRARVADKATPVSTAKEDGFVRFTVERNSTLANKPVSDAKHECGRGDREMDCHRRMVAEDFQGTLPNAVIGQWYPSRDNRATRIDRIRGGAVAQDLQVAWIGDTSESSHSKF